MISPNTKVLRAPNEHGSRKPEILDLTEELVETIARGNEILSPDQVRESLLAGREVYTFFSRYKVVS
ncbi:hypothetical protein [Mesorhizobium sp.]|uniref:hypothetical protein n=1 Tax=Mesorhizobium sp. TaxID=1871066 RepID=UPI000FE3D200|nr:hypothetical protein [Mesorhizobium sp.]RWI35516.1 MAG: hypothetical protein EOR14_28855 [Mesorhizobium sp.]RWJ03452.1 MAG: hypothetical protein EOR24_32235 [Mesorhizobium sp.]RWJ66315.1 MAG: hypothetical protein EOR34_28280 [Mesorhizobium sp.]